MGPGRPARISTCSSRRSRPANRRRASPRVPRDDEDRRHRRRPPLRRGLDVRPGRRLARPDPQVHPHRQPRLLPRRVARGARAAAGGQARSSPTGIIIDAKTGVSGAGRGGGVDVRLRRGQRGRRRLRPAQARPRAGDDQATLSTARRRATASLTFTPHLIPMTRGILSTCYARGDGSDDRASASTPRGSSTPTGRSCA